MEGLPFDVGQLVFSLLDVPSVCRLCIAFQSRAYVGEIRYWLATTKVEVTPEIVVKGDITKIDFNTLARLPALDIVVNTTDVYLDLTLWYLRRIEFNLISLTVDNKHHYLTNLRSADLRFMGSKLTDLSLIGTLINSDKIPKTLKTLRLEHFRYIPGFDLSHFTNLTHFEDRHCEYIDFYNPQLPELIVSVNHDSNLSRPIDGSKLPNLRHVRGRVRNLLWAQLESAHDIIPSLDRAAINLHTVHLEKRSSSFKGLKYPNLRIVKMTTPAPGSTLPDITEYFTKDQLAQLESVTGCLWEVARMSLLENVTVLHCHVHKEVTQDFPLPPHLVDWKIWTSESVKGIPMQIKHFTCICSRRESLLVSIDSSTLRSLNVENCRNLSLDCAKLTKLTMKSVISLTCWAPSVTNLIVILVGFDPTWLVKSFSRLAHIELDRSDCCNLVILRRLKSVTVMNLALPQLSVSADDVSIFCSALPLLTKIEADSLCFGYVRLIPCDVELTATTFKCQGSLRGVRKIVCRELECDEIDHIPLMVEKLTCSYVMPRNIYYSREDPALKLLQCHKLRYLNLTSGAVYQFISADNCLVLPPSVRQLRIDYFPELVLTIKTVNPLEYFECSARRNKSRFHFNQTPVSIRIGRNYSNFQPDLMY